MSWLRPRTDSHTTYDSRKEVDQFICEHGDLAKIVLNAFNLVDPFCCYYGEHVNPDEYLHYARLFIAAFNRGPLVQGEFKCTGFFEESVRKSFHPGQLDGSPGSVTEEQISSIARLIYSHGMYLWA